MTLAQAKQGSRLTVKTLNCEGSGRQRLIDMGLLAGTPVTVKRFAPLGDPMIIEVKNCQIAIRKKDASGIIVG